ncbi:MAG: hypothetical protein AAFQ82_15885, partial [Myxococcota bacterium]
MNKSVIFFVLLGLVGCGGMRGTEAPPTGWANTAPTVVRQVIERQDMQLLEVSQGELTTWVKIPNIHAKVGDYVLLGQGTAETDVEVPELGRRIPELVTIAHARTADLAEAKQSVFRAAPAEALTIEQVYSDLEQLESQEIMVDGAGNFDRGAID